MLFTKDGNAVKTLVGGLPLAALLQTMDDAKAASGG